MQTDIKNKADKRKTRLRKWTLWLLCYEIWGIPLTNQTFGKGNGIIVLNVNFISIYKGYFAFKL